MGPQNIRNHLRICIRYSNVSVLKMHKLGFLTFINHQKRKAVVEWLEQLDYGAESHQKVVSSSLGFAIQ